ncbi:hypothetical protein [Blastopirellula marina]|uniref:Carboxypeptidase regulatory-like domain-containing protein n=1 Tax=Blastopirellula marina DSM 3645 TaxID=314230 RepID=A3ZZY4_9BACT|nr:hypothetical protein [Blastopirellula marina]EAQ77928.1 hypothetical protein DSM3645_27156 [Blastopirellula marina DSM 3645]
MWYPPSFLAIILAASLLSGCSGNAGPKQVPVSGAVEYNGQPVTTGTIGFSPVETTQGKAVSANLVDGRYETAPDQGLEVGRYKVVVVAMEAIPEGVDPASVSSSTPKGAQIIPTKYSHAETSDLEIDITESDSQVEKDFKLTD